MEELGWLFRKKFIIGEYRVNSPNNDKDGGDVYRYAYNLD
jgi:hypothetical protein